MSLPELFEEYLKHGMYLRGWSEKTKIIYKRAFTSYQKSLCSCPQDGARGDAEAPVNSLLSKTHLEAWVISRREAGMSPSGINIYIRAMNAFSSWLKEEGHIQGEPIVCKQLRAPQKAISVFSSQDISLILSFKPRGFYELRTWTLLQGLLDTGCRVDEILGLRETDVDFENMLLSVHGKGSKYRKVPFSQDARKLFFRYGNVLKRKDLKFTLFFGNRHGGKLRYRNIYRDLINLCKKIGITKRVHPHLTRHTFACHFMKNGGSIYTLSRILGHSSVSTTQIYIRGLGIEDFKEEHARLSPLAKR